MPRYFTSLKQGLSIIVGVIRKGANPSTAIKKSHSVSWYDQQQIRGAPGMYQGVGADTVFYGFLNRQLGVAVAAQPQVGAIRWEAPFVVTR